jgi:hypothetical protein
MDVLTQFLTDGRLNAVTAVLALLALFAGAQRNLFGIVRMLSVITLLGVIYTVVLRLGPPLPANLQADLSLAAISRFLAVSSIFGLWAAQDESKSLARALERAAWAQVPLALASVVWLQLLGGEWDIALTVGGAILGGFMALLAGSLTFGANWLFSKLEPRLGSFDLMG